MVVILDLQGTRHVAAGHAKQKCVLVLPSRKVKSEASDMRTNLVEIIKS